MYPGPEAHTFGPSSLGGPRQADYLTSGVRNQRGQDDKTSFLLKLQKLVIPATQEAEAGELLEPGRWRL